MSLKFLAVMIAKIGINKGIGKIGMIQWMEKIAKPTIKLYVIGIGLLKFYMHHLGILSPLTNGQSLLFHTTIRRSTWESGEIYI